MARNNLFRKFRDDIQAGLHGETFFRFSYLKMGDTMLIFHSDGKICSRLMFKRFVNDGEITTLTEWAELHHLPYLRSNADFQVQISFLPPLYSVPPKTSLWGFKENNQ